MPEGDSIFRVADALRRAFLGRTISHAESAVAEVDVRRVEGAEVLDVSSRGKNLLVGLSSGFTLHTHLLMYGSWQLGARGAPWRRAKSQMRVAMATDEIEAVCFRTPLVRLVRTDRLARDPKLARLGPDPLAETWSEAEAVMRIASAGAQPLGEAILVQRNLAGVGNVLKSETLFLAGADPFAPVSAYDAAALGTIVALAARVLRLVVAPRADDGTGLRFREARRTTRIARASRGEPERLWVYGRAGGACFACGGEVRMRHQGLERRSTYWCPACQPARTDACAPLVAPAVGELGRVAPRPHAPAGTVPPWPRRRAR